MRKSLSAALLAALALPALAAQEAPADPAPAAQAPVALVDNQTLPFFEYRELPTPAALAELLQAVDVAKLPIVPDEESEVTWNGIIADFLLRRGGKGYLLTMYRTPGWFRVCRVVEGAGGSLRYDIEDEAADIGDFRDDALHAALKDAILRSAEAGDPQAQLLLARDLMSTQPDEASEARAEALHKQALAYFERSAQGGNATAQYNMGEFYREGTLVPKDYATALEFYHAAAQKGHAASLYAIGLMTERGQGVAASLPEALTLYRRAAELGDSDAMAALGEKYYKGEGVEQDFATALKWYSLAAEAGNPEAEDFIMDPATGFGGAWEQMEEDEDEGEEGSESDE